MWRTRPNYARWANSANAVWRTTNVSSAAATNAGCAAGKPSLNSAHCTWYKWCYDAIARIPWWWLLNLRLSPRSGLASASSRQWSSEITSAKSIDKSIAVTFRERIGIGIVDTFHKKYRYRYRRCYLKVSLTTLVDKQGVCISVTVCLFCVCVCTVTDYSIEDKANGDKFCMVVHWRPGQEISHFGEHCSPRSPKSTNRLRRLRWEPWCGRHRCVHRPRVGSAYVDIRPSRRRAYLSVAAVQNKNCVFRSWSWSEMPQDHLWVVLVLIYAMQSWFWSVT